MPSLGFKVWPHRKWSAVSYPRSPGTHVAGPWVTDSIELYRDLRTGTQYIGNWASRALNPKP